MSAPLHDWMYRFGFPGGAETLWVLPAGVRHDAPWYEPLDWIFGCAELGRWSLDPACHEKLADLHAALFGAPHGVDSSPPLSDQVAALGDAFRQERIIVWCIRMTSVSAPGQLPQEVPIPKPLPPTEKRMWFEVVVVDELGQPVSGASLELAFGEGKETRSTDAGGKARVDDVKGSSASLRFSREAPVRQILHDRWSQAREKEWIDPSTLGAHTEASVRRRELLVSATVFAEERHTIVLEPVVVRGICFGAWFDAGRTFLLPSAIEGARFAIKLSRERRESDLLVVGHVDEIEEAADPNGLSLDRARSVVAYLKRDVDAWLDCYDDGRSDEARWGRREDLLMIEATASARGEVIPFGVGLVGWYRKARGVGVGETADPAMRRVLIAEYMALAGPVLGEDIRASPHGCGASFPLPPSGDASEGARIRMIELFSFENPIAPPDRPPAILPEPPGEISKPGAKEYREWVLRAKTPREHAVDAATPIDRVHVSLLLRSNSASVSLIGRPFKLHSNDGRFLEGVTGDDGFVEAKDVSPADYRIEVDGVSAWVPSLPLEIDRRVTRIPGYLLDPDPDGT